MNTILHTKTSADKREDPGTRRQNILTFIHVWR